MVNFKKIAVFIAIILFGVGCFKDTIEGVGVVDGVSSNIISFSVEAPTETDVSASTKATSYTGLTLHYGYIFFFDSEGNYVGNYYVDNDVDQINNNGTQNPSFEINADDYINTYKLVCVFNFDKTSCSRDFTGITKDNVSDYFPMSTDFLTTVQTSQNGGNSYNGTHYDIGIPMFVNDFTDLNNSTHEIYRAVARMSIAMPEGITIEHESHSHTVDVGDIQYTIVNYANEGSIGFSSLSSLNPVVSEVEENQTLIYNGDDELLFDNNINKYVEGADYSTDARKYLFEFPYSTKDVDGGDLNSEEYSSNRFAIILSHKDSYSFSTLYYKLNLFDKIENKYFDVERNHDYRIVIKAIYSRGYESLREAYLMPPSNIEYEIYDDMGELTYSNGQYAISMDEILNYEKIQIYGHSSATVEFNNIRYIIPDEMSSTVDINDLTNSVEFAITDIVDGEYSDEDWDGLDDEISFSVTTVKNDFENAEYLTADGRSIQLEVTGVGSCTIQLMIKLGNLEIGRESITISKDADDGVMDAHPSQIEFDDVIIDADSWNTTESDFGVWYDSQNQRSIVYMGDNAVPTGYKTMDGYISSGNSKDSYPIFSEKTRTAYYTYTHPDATDDPVKTKIVVVQLAPAYLGHFGSLADEGSTNHFDALIAERIEEISRSSTWEGDFDTDGVLNWSTSTATYYNSGLIYDYGASRYINLVEGRDITQYIVENNTGSTDYPTAARYCYYKNDINGDKVIGLDEPIEWYLPAQNQMLAMWINKTALQEDARYDLNGNEGDEYVYYWSSSEINGGSQTPNGAFPDAISMNIIEGEQEKSSKGSWKYAHVRCVRGVKH